MKHRTHRKPHFERVPLEPTSSCRYIHEYEQGHALFMHYHPEIELTLQAKGRGIRFVGDSVQPYSEGDLCLLGPNLLHTWYTGEEPQDTETIVIQFRPQLLIQAGQQWPEFRRLSQLNALCVRGIVIGTSAAGPISDMLYQVVDAPPDSAKRLLLFLQIADALCDVTDYQTLSTSSPLIQQTDPSLARFQKVIDSLHAEMPNPPDQGAMASLAGMTPAGFSRFFKRIVGRSYVDYVNSWRIGLACQRLMQTDAPITQIAFDCGFENLSNFNRRFQQYKNMTPRQYRSATRQTTFMDPNA